MKEPKYKSVGELPRNDAQAAFELFTWLTARGEWDADMGRVLLMLQDDPSELLELLGGAEELGAEEDDE